MKELNFEQMENVQGGVNCFLTAIGFVGCAGLGPIIGPAWGVFSGIFSDSYNCLTS